ncbi:MAG: nucleotide exchange factor GrpE [Chitinophagales bacterium]
MRQFDLKPKKGRHFEIFAPVNQFDSMEENNNTEKENLKDRVDDLKHTINEKAEEIGKTAKEKAGNFAEKTITAAEKLVNDLLGKKPEDVNFEEEKTDPKDVEISELKREMEELRDKYVRLYADFDNYKKRTAKQNLEIIQTASKDVVKDVLPVLDDFERALKASDASSKEGIQLIYNKLLNTLTAKGLKAMETIGQTFDADKHEAITEVPAPTPDLAGKVVDEVEKGYYLNDKIIRFAKVVVGK